MKKKIINLKFALLICLCVVFPVFGFSQGGAMLISGTIKDSSGVPMQGVSVLLKGSPRGTSSDAEGKYSIKVDRPDDVLVFSSLGMRSEEIPVAGRASIDVVLAQTSQVLEDIVVTALGVTRKKKSLSYAAQDISGAEFTKVKDANVLNSISGKVAGVTVSRSGSGTGGSVKIVIRGNASANNNDPLYVVDGVPMLNSVTRSAGQIYNSSTEGGDAVSLINSEDIESMTVLKGASAAALYGNQGANGVILITTKSGKSGKTEVQLTSSTFANFSPYLPASQHEYLNGNQETSSWGPKDTGGVFSKTIPERFFQVGLEQNTGISVSSGNATLRSFASFSNVTTTGIVPTNTMSRNTFTLREIKKLFDGKVELDASVSYTLQEIKNRPLAGLYYNPLVGVMLGAGDVFDKYNGSNYQTFDSKTLLYKQNWPGINETNQNPYWILNNAPTVNKNDRLQALFAVTYNVFSWLNIKGRLNYGRFTTTNDRKAQAGTYTTLAHPTGLYELFQSESTQFYADAIASANKSFGKFDLNVLVGGAYKNVVLDNALSFNSGVNDGLLVPNYFNISNFKSSVNNGQSIGDRQEVQSVFGSATLGYKKQIYLDVSVRTDWSSTLAFTDQLSITYPSVGVSAVLSEILHLPDFISFAKVSASVAQVGNGLSSFLTTPQYAIIRGTLTAPSIGPNPSQKLKPEIQTSYEVGTDWGFFGQRLKVGLTFYHNVTENQYIKVTAPPSNPYGYQQYGINAGSILNQGLEFTLGAVPFKTADFKWNTDVNFAYFRNMVLSLPPSVAGADPRDGKGIIYLSSATGTANYAYVLKEGEPYGIIQGTKLETDASGKILLNKANGNKPIAGNQFVDLGQVFPNFTVGWSNTFSYKNWTLYFIIDSKIGGNVMSLTQAAMDYSGTSQKTADERDQGAVAASFQVVEPIKNADGSTTYLPTSDQASIDPHTFYLATQANYGRSGASSMATYSATNVVLREISLSYKFQFKNNRFIKNIDVALLGRNLFFFYKDAPIDPNVVSSTGNSFQGLEVFGLPGFRSVGLNLNFTF